MEYAKLNVVRFDAQDVIATSGADPNKITIANCLNGTTGDMVVTYMGTDYTSSTQSTLQGLFTSDMTNDSGPFFYKKNSKGSYRVTSISALFSDDEDDNDGSYQASTYDGTFTWTQKETSSGVFEWGFFRD